MRTKPLGEGPNMYVTLLRRFETRNSWPEFRNLPNMVEMLSNLPNAIFRYFCIPEACLHRWEHARTPGMAYKPNWDFRNFPEFLNLHQNWWMKYLRIALFIGYHPEWFLRPGSPGKGFRIFCSYRFCYTQVPHPRQGRWEHFCCFCLGFGLAKLSKPPRKDKGILFFIWETFRVVLELVVALRTWFDSLSFVLSLAVVKGIHPRS